MTRQYKRRCSLILASDSEALDLSELHIQFKITSQDLQTPNSARIRVWNPSSSTVNRAMKEFTRVVLQVGYGQDDAGLGTLFDGSIIQAMDGKASATDSYLDIVAADGDQAYIYGVVRQSLAAGATQADVAKAAVAAMGEHGVTPGYTPENLGGAPSPRGVVLFGMARDTLNDVAANTDSRWSIQNGQAQIVPNSGVIPNTAVVLTSATGLIGRPEQTQDGIKIRCLINPQIKIGGALQVNNTSINKAALNTGLQSSLNNDFLPRVADDGFYRVLLADHDGDTRGQNWYSDLTCIALGDAATQGLVNRGLN